MNYGNRPNQLSRHSVLRLLAFLSTMGGVSGHAVTQVPCGYEIAHIIQAPPASDPPTTVATAISPNGEYVVGFSYRVGGDERGWVYRMATSQFTTILMPPGISVMTAEDVNDEGKIAGTMGGGNDTFAFIYNLNTGVYETLIPPLMPGQSVMTGINSSGWACGYRTISSQMITSAFVWSPKHGLIDLGVMNGPFSRATDITENNIVVGWTGGGLLTTGTRGFLWQDGKLTIMPPIPGGLSSAAMASNDVPQVLLWGHYPPQPGSPNRSYLWEDGGMTDIGMLPGYQRSRACSINNSSVIVGLCSNPSQVGYIWGAGVMQPLSDLIIDTKGVTGITAEMINDGGQLPANGHSPTGFVVGVILLPAEGAPGDANCDHHVNIIDLLEVVATWGPCVGCVTDFTGDEAVNILDLLFVVQNWTVP